MLELDDIKSQVSKNINIRIYDKHHINTKVDKNDSNFKRTDYIKLEVS